MRTFVQIDAQLGDEIGVNPLARCSNTRLVSAEAFDRPRLLISCHILTVPFAHPRRPRSGSNRVAANKMKLRLTWNQPVTLTHMGPNGVPFSIVSECLDCFPFFFPTAQYLLWIHALIFGHTAFNYSHAAVMEVTSKRVCDRPSTQKTSSTHTHADADRAVN